VAIEPPVRPLGATTLPRGPGAVARSGPFAGIPPRFLTLLGLAALLTFLNCFKPLHIDDACYYYFAKQIVERPLDPYCFEVNWDQDPVPANQVLAPPVFLYWWALGIRLFGQNPILWKLWLLPIAFLLAYSLGELFRRFAQDTSPTRKRGSL